MKADEPGLPTRVYVLVIAAAVVTVVLLYWFTQAYNVPLGAA